MFKNTDKISKAIDLLVKVTQDTESDERKEQTVEVIHSLSKLQQDHFKDLTNISE